MGPFIMFWLIGEGLMSWRSVKLYSAPPLPSALLATSGLFVILAFVAEFQPGFAMMLAAGFDVAAFLAVAGTPPKPKCPKAGPAGPLKTPFNTPGMPLPGTTSSTAPSTNPVTGVSV